LESRILRSVLKLERFVLISLRGPSRRFQTSTGFSGTKRGRPRIPEPPLESRGLIALQRRALRVAGVRYDSEPILNCRKATQRPPSFTGIFRCRNDTVEPADPTAANRQRRGPLPSAAHALPVDAPR